MIKFIKLKNKSAKQAQSCMPWACKVVKVADGWMGFEHFYAYTIWRNQK